MLGDMSGTQSRDSRVAWAQLNADGFLIAMLALVAGVFDLLQPNYSQIAEQLGHEPLSFYVWSFCYALGGVLMLGGFMIKTIGVELLGRLLVIVAAWLEAVIVAIAFGGAAGETWYRLLMATLVSGLFTLRASALSRRGGVAVILTTNGEALAERVTHEGEQDGEAT